MPLEILRLLILQDRDYEASKIGIMKLESVQVGD